MPRKLFLWKCPNGEHRSVRAPSKPRLDDIRRYCLPCSEACGRLTERVAPAVEKVRERKDAARKRKAATKARRAAKKAKARREHSPTVWPDVLHKQYNAIKVGDTAQRLWSEGVTLQLVKARTKASSGRCQFKAKMIVVKAGTFKPGARTQLAYQCARYVAHLGGRKDDASVAQVLYALARETFPGLHVDRWAEPDLVEVMRELVLHYAKVEAKQGR